MVEQAKPKPRLIIAQPDDSLNAVVGPGRKRAFFDQCPRMIYVDRRKVEPCFVEMAKAQLKFGKQNFCDFGVTGLIRRVVLSPPHYPPTT